jgi:Holliday junction DNA helicase RuvA
MIGRLRGELAGLEGSVALVDCAGVGYEVSVPDHVAMALPREGEPVTLLVRQIVREEGSSLYGFLLPFQRRMFDLLLEVKGCGPKVAMSLLGQLGEDAVATAILSQDAKMLARASGVGARLAERILLELKDKVAQESLIQKIEASSARPASADPELVDALLALGYRRLEAEDAAAKASGPNLEARLRSALQLLRK